MAAMGRRAPVADRPILVSCDLNCVAALRPCDVLALGWLSEREDETSLVSMTAMRVAVLTAPQLSTQPRLCAPWLTLDKVQ